MKNFTFNGSLNFEPNDGQLINTTISIYSQKGAVIKGRVVFPCSCPVPNATAVLSILNDDCSSTPISFTLTNENGEFIFAIKDTDLNYVINVTYNEEYY